jgi:hypothetical protein
MHELEGQRKTRQLYFSATRAGLYCELLDAEQSNHLAESATGKAPTQAQAEKRLANASYLRLVSQYRSGSWLRTLGEILRHQSMLLTPGECVVVHCKISIASFLQVSPKLVNASDPRKGSYCALPAVLRLRGTGENRSKEKVTTRPQQRETRKRFEAAVIGQNRPRRLERGEGTPSRLLSPGW